MLQLRCKAQYSSQKKGCVKSFMLLNKQMTPNTYLNMLKVITTAINIKSKENSCKKIFCVFADKQRSDFASSFSRVIRNWFVMPI